MGRHHFGSAVGYMHRVYGDRERQNDGHSQAALNFPTLVPETPNYYILCFSDVSKTRRD